jgi:hypothetical protein
MVGAQFLAVLETPVVAYNFARLGQNLLVRIVLPLTALRKVMTNPLLDVPTKGFSDDPSPPDFWDYLSSRIPC